MARTVCNFSWCINRSSLHFFLCWVSNDGNKNACVRYFFFFVIVIFFVFFFSSFSFCFDLFVVLTPFLQYKDKQRSSSSCMVNACTLTAILLHIQCKRISFLNTHTQIKNIENNQHTKNRIFVHSSRILYKHFNCHCFDIGLCLVTVLYIQFCLQNTSFISFWAENAFAHRWALHVFIIITPLACAVISSKTYIYQ